MSFISAGRLQYRPGFTLIELVIVVALIGFLLTLVSPMLFQPKPSYQREKFIDELSNMIADGLLGALELEVLHRVVFNLDEKKISVEKSTEEKDSQGNLKFVAADGQASLSLPENLEIKNFYINGSDAFVQTLGARTKKIWFYITSSGAGQEVIINMIDMNDLDQQGKPAQLSLVLNPFNLSLTTYGIFQKP